MSGKMTRQEHIDHAVIGLSSEYLFCISRQQYEALYGNKIGQPAPGGFIGFDYYPTWEEAVISQKPWLASEETMAEWFKPVMLTDEDRTRIAEERAKYPTLGSDALLDKNE